MFIFSKTSLVTISLLVEVALSAFWPSMGRIYSSEILSNIQFNDEAKYVKMCGIKCEESKKSCTAFQVDLIKDAVCYHFNYLPDLIFKKSNPNCSVYAVSTLSKFVFLNVSSWGFTDLQCLPECHCPVNSTRALILYKLELLNNTAHDVQQFDTYADTKEAIRMTNYLMNTANGTIVVGRSCDEISTRMAPALPYLASVNLNLTNLQYRGKWLFVWQQGAYGKALSFVDNTNLLTTDCPGQELK
ncbi:hypothetical protein HELRODRAFT_165701 [Helobdella robusta]|uniref:ILEI/PANDER domain-containing protein n=1 Tax=Helobdella robusta TaxID=6412 RepID=T1EX68_HELRO|nr:hypothetical protein HELRODRAFT_165701 [Helobdella robusta]ESN91648.1 hypothetical protein HELRODRAFT_165701 [Helobdella robusta]